MFHVVLVHPEIPPNTGNIIRQCAATGSTLHLIEPVYFDMSDKRLQRAGLDYHEFATVQRHSSWASFSADIFTPDRAFYFDTKGTRAHTQVNYQPGDWLIFGNEQRGLPGALLDAAPAGHVVRQPMLPNRRSLNLATSVGIGLYEAWRQCGFVGADLEQVQP